MTKRIRILLGIMLCCLLGLLLMQGYLAYQEYKRQQDDFVKLINELFEKAVQSEQQYRVDYLTDLFIRDLNDPELVRIEARPDPDTSRMLFDFFDAGDQDLKLSVAFNGIAPSEDGMTPELYRRLMDKMRKEVRDDLLQESIVYWTDRLGERLDRHARELPVDTPTLSSNFRHQLDSLGIGSSFTISIDTVFDPAPGDHPGSEVRTVPLPLFGQQWIDHKSAAAIIDNPAHAVFKRSLLTIGGSASVIVLTLLCFYLLFATILRQKKLSEMKDDFIDNVTHELQTPIAVLRLAIESLENFEINAGKERYSAYLQLSTRELNRLSELVDRILLHNTDQQEETVKRESLDLMELLSTAAERHRLQADKPVSVRLPQWEVFEVRVSRFYLNTIVDNLLQNAIRYSDEQGVHIDIRLDRRDDGFLFGIADDGWGIAPEDKQQIFEKFYRSSDKDRNYTIKGMGIGLYHVRRCVQALGGRIQLRDNQPKGTVVEVIVPHMN